MHRNPSRVTSDAELLALSDEGSVILVLTEAPRPAPSSFEVRPVSTFEEHFASIDVANEAFAHPESDAADTDVGLGLLSRPSVPAGTRPG